MKIRLKRVYDPPTPEDGYRVLVDRIWPRGLGKDRAKIDLWLKDIAPSTALRRWFNHDPEKWHEFERRYRRELAGLSDLLDQVKGRAKASRVTLLYAAKNTRYNNAVALKSFLESE
ncbi:MAG: DUF488 domain-containing protein [Gammaproteobacteria bacterium]|jgi:uncharacterized protein YeaO (DUF488 family)